MANISHAEIVKISKLISPRNMVTIAIEYFNMNIEEIEHIEECYRNNSLRINIEILKYWSNQIGRVNKRKRLHYLLKNAGKEHGLVGPEAYEFLLEKNMDGDSLALVACDQGNWKDAESQEQYSGLPGRAFRELPYGAASSVPTLNKICFDKNGPPQIINIFSNHCDIHLSNSFYTQNDSGSDNVPGEVYGWGTKPNQAGLRATGSTYRKRKAYEEETHTNRAGIPGAGEPREKYRIKRRGRTPCTYGHKCYR